MFCLFLVPVVSRQPIRGSSARRQGSCRSGARAHILSRRQRLKRARAPASDPLMLSPAPAPVLSDDASHASVCRQVLDRLSSVLKPVASALFVHAMTPPPPHTHTRTSSHRVDTHALATTTYLRSSHFG